MIYGYVRATLGEDDLRRQRALLIAAGAEAVIEENDAGGRWPWPELRLLLERLEQGDTLVVWKLDRLSRALWDVLLTLERIERIGAGFRSLGDSLDTTAPEGRGAVRMLSALTELERSAIRERTRAGLDAARARGRVGGRRPKISAEASRAIAEEVLSGSATGAEMARRNGVSEATISRIVARHRKASLDDVADSA